MNLMVVESPKKAKKLVDILKEIRPGEIWRIEASVGHIRDLPATGQEPGEITTGVKADFMPRYEPTERGASIVGRLQELAGKANKIYLATDPDREGESISWHLKEALALQNPTRITFNEITVSAVRKALDNQRRIDMKLVGAQEARRVLDRLVGYMVSAELRRQSGEPVSAGRVQSPALYLVVLREREIRAFRVTAHFGAELSFASGKPEQDWVAEWLTKPNFTSDENPYFMDKRYAELVAAVRRVAVVAFEEKDASRNPPAPFTTSTLQQGASNALKFDPEVTMKLAQSLFDQGHISYHRTDNPNVSEDSMEAIRAAAKALGLEVVSERRKFESKGDAQEAHPGITPTYWDVPVAGDTPEEQQLYNLIRVRALASQLMPAKFKARSVILESESPVEGKSVRFGATGRTLIEEGWMKLVKSDATVDEEEEQENNRANSNPIPLLQPGQVLDATGGWLKDRKTKSPPRYTQASLIKALEAHGVGRPATYAAIMKNIIDKNYVGVVKRQLVPLPLGEDVVIARLENAFSFLDIGFTRELEEDLDRIATGQAHYKGVIQKLHAALAVELGQQQSNVPTFKKVEPVYPCPECGKPLRKIEIKASGTLFWGCTAHPQCKGSLPDDKGKPGKKVEPSNFACGVCGKPLIRRKKPGKDGYDFWGCSGYKEGCKTSYPNLKGNKPDMTAKKG